MYSHITFQSNLLLVMLLLPTFILFWSNIKRKRGKLTFTGTSVLMGIVFWHKYCIHRAVPAAGQVRSGPCTCVPSHIQKTTQHLRHWNCSYPWVKKGWGSVCVRVWQTEGAVSITEPVSDSSLCQTQLSRCLLNLSQIQFG